MCRGSGGYPRRWHRLIYLVFVCFVLVISWVPREFLWYIYPYNTGLLHWWWDAIASLPVKQFWKNVGRIDQYLTTVISQTVYHLHISWVYCGGNTEMEMSPFWWNFHHWLHWKLSKGQLLMQPVTKISSKWGCLCFSECWIIYRIMFLIFHNTKFCMDLYHQWGIFMLCSTVPSNQWVNPRKT